MSIFHVALAIYGGLTLVAVLVGMSACVVAGRSSERQVNIRLKRPVRTATAENSAPNVTGKKWVLNSH